MTRGERVIAWIEANLFIPAGKHAGNPVRLLRWQKRDILRIYDNPYGTRRAILSFGRKNGKTALAAMLMLVHLCGPEARMNGQLYSAAQSRDQAAILFELAAKMVRMSPTLVEYVHIRDTYKEMEYAELGTFYKALSADAKTKYGLAPVFLVHDELGQVRGPKSELYEALETATGAAEAPLSIVISTQAPTDADLLSLLIDDGLAGHDPCVVVSLYTCPVKKKGEPDYIDPFTDEALQLANPAFGEFQNADELRRMAADASRMPARESEYRNLVLNQRIEARAPFVSRTSWESCDRPVLDKFTGEVYLGLDLSAVRDLTACVAISAVEAFWHVRPTFWLPTVDLDERARRDRVPYDVWAKQGLIELTPGATIEYEYVAQWLFQKFGEWRIAKVGFDRWNMKHFRPWLKKAGFKDADIEGEDSKFIEFGQGTESMSPALRTLESAILSETLCHGGHPVLTMCMGNAVVNSPDPSNRKLDKARSSGRIDGAVALAMAIGVAGANKPKDTKSVGIRILG
jgi:phage terminase large subunit-like protein